MGIDGKMRVIVGVAYCVGCIVPSILEATPSPAKWGLWVAVVLFLSLWMGLAQRWARNG